MQHDDPESTQAVTVAFLKSELGRIDQRPVSSVQTHISVILLSATLAWKLKKAVRLPYLDFCSPETRLALCHRELEMNRRTAPDLYRKVRVVLRQADGLLRLEDAAQDDGALVDSALIDSAPVHPTLVDAVLEMGRFDEHDLLDHLAVRGELRAPLITRLADVIADFHQRVAPATRLERSGSQRLADILAINEASLASGSTCFDAGAMSAVVERTRAHWRRFAPLLDARQEDGYVRLCHGDLHLRNIVAIDDVPTLFDCLEFDVDMATIDVLYDLAFVLMDLWHRDLMGLANLLFNRYLDAIDETAGLPLLGWFMAIRATVRAHVTATQASDPGSGDEARAETLAEARNYLALANRLLRSRPPRLVAIGGLSGSGKSTVAAAVAAGVGAAPGARILSSDRLRKQLHGVSPETRLPAAAYQPDISARVYALMFEQAGAILASGHSVIVDAVFDRETDRAAIEAVAVDTGTAFQGIWLEAPAGVLLERVDARQGDPSDADRDVLRKQLQRDLGRLEWSRIDAGDGETVERLRRLLD